MDSIGKRYRSLGASVTEELRTAIMIGALAPGDRLVEDDIADRFGVSRMPVREALSILQIEGFVDIASRRGATVATISPAEALQLFEVRAMLEGLAARLAARRKGEADFQHLTYIVDAGRRAATENHQAEQADLHRQFHLGLAEAAANRYLIDLAAPLPAKIDWIFSTTVRAPSSISWNEHARILEAVSSGDEALAEQITRSHVEDSAEEYLKLLAQGGLDLVD
jgi:DNA-binding GntR family transcriptional regulator